MWRKLGLLILAFLLVGQTTSHQAWAQADTLVERPPTKRIIVAAAATPEQLFFGQILQILLKQAGYTVIDQSGAADMDQVRAALESGEADLSVAQVGDALIRYHQLPPLAIPATPERAFTLAAALDQPHGLAWLGYSPVNHSQALIVPQALAAAGIDSLSALAAAVKQEATRFTLCADAGFLADEAGGFVALQQHYAFQWQETQVRTMAPDDIYRALQNGECSVGLGQRLDGRIAQGELVVLSDPLAFFAIQVIAPVLRAERLDADPALQPLLTSFLPHLTDAILSECHARMVLGADGVAASGDEETPDAVAFRFLERVGLAKFPTIRVGSHAYTENLLLGELAGQMLERGGFTVEQNAGIPDALTLRSAIEEGAIDLYVELIGDALTLYHELPANALPTDPDRALTLVRTLDQQKGLIWLNRTPFNDTFAIMVRPQLLDLGIRSIADLGQYMNEHNAPFTICVETDFLGREADGLEAMTARHGFRFLPEKVLLMDYDLLYEALRNGECDIAEGYSTDGRIAAWQLASLADTLAFFPFFNAAPVVRQELLETHPAITDLLNSFLPYLDDATMSRLNALVDIGPDGVFDSGDEQTPATVAADFLQSVGLLSASGITATTPVTIATPVTITDNSQAVVTQTLTLTTPTVSTADSTNLQSIPVITPPAPTINAPTLAQQPSPLVVVELFVAVASGVNVRAGPSLEAERIGGFAQGATVRAVGRTADSSWLQVELAGADTLAWLFTAVVVADPVQIATLPIVEPGLSTPNNR